MTSELNDLVFRSRTERMWAGVIVESGYSLQYEPKTFKTAHGFYCPDFYIRELDLFIEVKGIAPTPIEREKLKAVESETGSYCIFFCGTPQADVNGPVSGDLYPVNGERPISLNMIWNIDKGQLLLAAIARAKMHLRSPCLVNRYFASGCLSGNYDLITPGEQISIMPKPKQDPWLARIPLFLNRIRALSA